MPPHPRVSMAASALPSPHPATMGATGPPTGGKDPKMEEGELSFTSVPNSHHNCCLVDKLNVTTILLMQEKTAQRS